MEINLAVILQTELETYMQAKEDILALIQKEIQKQEHTNCFPAYKVNKNYDYLKWVKTIKEKQKYLSKAKKKRYCINRLKSKTN